MVDCHFSDGKYIKNGKGKCLRATGQTIVEVPCSRNDLSLRWQRIRLFHLLNIKTLKCLQWNDAQEFTVARCKSHDEMQQWLKDPNEKKKIALTKTTIDVKPIYSNLSFGAPVSHTGNQN